MVEKAGTDELINHSHELLQHLLECNEAILVQLMRLYDVSMTQLMTTAPEQAQALEKLHDAGRVISSMPYLVEVKDHLNIEQDKDNT